MLSALETPLVRTLGIGRLARRRKPFRSFNDAHSGRGLAFEAGAPDDSRMIELVSQRGFLTQMPPLGTDVVDQAAVSLLRSWVAGMH